MTTTQTVLAMLKTAQVNLDHASLDRLLKDANLRRQQGYGRVGVRNLVKQVIRSKATYYPMPVE